MTAAPAASAGNRESYAYLEEAGEFGWDVVTTGPNGATPVRVAVDAVGRPAISPNGAKVAYAAPIGDGTLGRFAIFVSNLDGSARTRLTGPAFGDRDPAWSPDGQWLAFSRDLKPTLRGTSCCAIRLIRANGTGIASVLNSIGGRNPAWSPGGDRIAYETPAGVVVSDLDGGNRILLTGPSGTEPAWSPDGTTIAYIRPLSAGSELVVRPANGGAFTVRSSSSQYRIESPVWDPDSRTVYYVRYLGDGYLGRRSSSIWSHTPGVGSRQVFNPNSEIAHLSLVRQTRPGCDFDGDGFEDLAIGVPGDNTGANSSGSVNVLYGSTTGIVATGAQIWHRNRTVVIGIARAGAELGAAVTCGDFNGDGFTDLAAGAPGDEQGRGSVMVLRGSANGLTGAADQRWEQDTSGVASSGEPGDNFGAALVSGDFNGDGYGDLAIGAPGEGSSRGGVNVLFGSANGLTSSGDVFLRQGAGGVAGTGQAGEDFGAALAAGDFDGDGIDDLAIGAPGEILGSKQDSGSVLVIPGSPGGLDTNADVVWHQDTSGVLGGAEPGDQFGWAVTASDFNGDGYADLAIGAPGEDRSAVADSGSVHVLYGGPSGLTAEGDQRWFQGVDGINGFAERDDRLGTSLTSGDFDGDGFADLAVGAPGENAAAGMVNVLYGSSSGVNGDRDQLWSRTTSGVIGSAAPNHAFGADVTRGDFDGDGFDDLSIGTPGANRPGAQRSGVAHVLYGSSNRITAIGDQVWHQDSPGVPGTAAGDDGFGSAVH